MISLDHRFRHFATDASVFDSANDQAKPADFKIERAGFVPEKYEMSQKTFKTSFGHEIRSSQTTGAIAAAARQCFGVKLPRPSTRHWGEGPERV